jgi:hypothetical protein
MNHGTAISVAGAVRPPPIVMLSAIGEDRGGMQAQGYSFQNCCFRGTFLSGADFSGATFEACDFRDADISHARLVSARFSGCLLEDSSLASSDLTNLIVTGSNLARGNLENALLSGLRMSECRVDGANLRGARDFFLCRPLVVEVLRQATAVDVEPFELIGVLEHRRDLCWDYWHRRALSQERDLPERLVHWAIDVFASYPESGLLGAIHGPWRRIP